MSESNKLLQPGVPIKPKVTQSDVEVILKEVFGLKCVKIKELNGYDDNNYHVIVEKSNRNDYIKQINEDGYVLKIVNFLDSLKPEFFEAQNQILIHLGKQGIVCPKSVQTKTGEYFIIRKLVSGNHIVRLLEYIPGTILHQVPSSNQLFLELGRHVANLDLALKNFYHPAYDTLETIWHLQNFPKLSQFMFAIEDPNRLRIVEEVIDDFTKNVIPASSQLEKGMIHGDFNEQNVLVEEKDNKWVFKAILDFGDTHSACYLYELAITMTYMMIQGKSIDVGGYVLFGYTSVRKLPEIEYDLLKVCTAARFCQTLVMGAYSSLQDPDNAYILTTAKAGWLLLQELWRIPKEELLQRWRSVAE